MLKQRQVRTMFDLFARAVGAGRSPVVVLPLAALLVAATLSLRDGGRVDVATDSLGDAGVSTQLALFTSMFAPRLTLPAVPLPWETMHDDRARQASPAASRSPLKLSPEQHKIAKFVAGKYRIAVDDVQHLVAHAYRAAKELTLDPYLLLAVMSIESSFDPNARSAAGAQGLMQVLTRVHVDKFAPFGGAAAAFDPVANISVGSRILKEYLVREGSVEGALKSYVGAALHEHDSGYGYKVMSERERIAAAAAGRPIPAKPLSPPVVDNDTRATALGGASGASGSTAAVALRSPEQLAAPLEGVYDTLHGGAAHGAAAAASPANFVVDAAADEPAQRAPLGPTAL